MSFLRALLKRDNFDRANKYLRWQDQQAFLLGRFLLVEGLERMGLNISYLDKINYTKYNRPYLPLDIDFNITHSGDYILCAISDNCGVGVDIEEVRDIEPNEFSNLFTEQEFTSIMDAANRVERFFTYWTLKEAAIKADGRGLSIPLNEVLIKEPFVSIQGKDWYYKNISIQSRYVTHLVCDKFDVDHFTIRHIGLSDYI